LRVKFTRMARPKKWLEQTVRTDDRMAGKLVGLAEIAQMLDTSRTQVGRWTEREDFPPPIERLRMGPIWKRADVERWAKRRKPNGRRKR
jgi:prophage regulatory protein